MISTPFYLKPKLKTTTPYLYGLLFKKDKENLNEDLDKKYGE